MTTKTQDPTLFIYIGWAIAAFGAYSILRSLWAGRQKKQAEFLEVHGVIKDYVENKKDNRFLNPVISFVFDGQEYTFTDKQLTVPFQKQTGRNVLVSFNPANPEEASIKEKLSSYNIIVSGVVFAFGIGLIVLLDASLQQKIIALLPGNLSSEDLIMIVACAIFLMFGAFTAKMLLKSGLIKTVGTITGYKEAGRTKKGRQLYVPKIEFYVDGEKYEFTESIFSQTSIPQEGKQIKVQYNPANPREARLDTWLKYIFPIAFPAFVLFMIIVYIFGE